MIPSGKEVLRVLKDTAGSPGMLCIPVGRPVRALLRPVPTHRDRMNADDVHYLTDWRNRHVNAFLTQFHATEARTAKWLSEVVGPSQTKVLFMVDDLSRRTFGYMGLDFIDWQRRSGEADAIVRGAEAPAGLMAESLRTLMLWARVQLGLHCLGVRVRSDNSALEFYRKLGFREVRRVGLRRIDEPDRGCWVEDDSLPVSGLCLVHMELPEQAVAARC